MDTIMVLFGIALTVLIISWIIYSNVTDQIIKSQEREIAMLKRRLKHERRV